jgi:hypothetical protein
LNKLPNHTALKEWANVVDALGSGSQVILIRKGGIADPKFGVEAERFYLYPTYFHQGEQEPRTSVEVTHWCEVARVWTIRELADLERLESMVVMPKETLLARYRFRPDQALHVIGVRTYRLPVPQTVVFRPEYGGCISWVSVDEEVDVTDSTAAIEEEALLASFAEIDAAIGAGQSAVSAAAR